MNTLVEDRPLSPQEIAVRDRIASIRDMSSRAFSAERVSALWPDENVTMEALLVGSRERSWFSWQDINECNLSSETWGEVNGYGPVSSETMRVYGTLQLPEAVLIAAHNRLFGFKTEEPCQLAVELIAMALFNNDHNKIRVRGAWLTWSELVARANAEYNRKHKAQAQIAHLMREWG